MSIAALIGVNVGLVIAAGSASALTISVAPGRQRISDCPHRFQRETYKRGSKVEALTAEEAGQEASLNGEIARRCCASACQKSAERATP